jgi:sulfatase maturation enzyme AslB (radical SAM superfamily)
MRQRLAQSWRIRLLVNIIRETRQVLEEVSRLERYALEAAGPVNLDVPRAPLILRVEVTNRCNANCVFCAYQYQERPFAVMTFEIFKRAVDQYTALGGRAINFSPIVGEALIDKQLEEKVAYVRQFPQYVKLELFTNGILLTKERFESLVDAGVNQFHVALSGFSAAEYERVYRNTSYTKLFNNLTAIAESDRIRDVSFVVHSRTDSLYPENEPDYQKLRAIAPFPIHFEPGVVSWHGSIRQEDLPGHLFLVKGPRDQRKPCFLLWGGLTVLADGRMTLCGCTDVNGTGLPLGNIQSVDLNAHLLDGRWERWRDGFFRGSPPDFCKGCDSYWPHG